MKHLEGLGTPRTVYIMEQEDMVSVHLLIPYGIDMLAVGNTLPSALALFIQMYQHEWPS